MILHQWRLWQRVKQDAAETDKKVENIESEPVMIDGTTKKEESEGKVEGNMEETKTDDEPKKDAEETVNKEGEGEQVMEGESQDVKQENGEFKKKTAEESESKDAEEGQAGVVDGATEGKEQERPKVCWLEVSFICDDFQLCLEDRFFLCSVLKITACSALS